MGPTNADVRIMGLEEEDDAGVDRGMTQGLREGIGTTPSGGA